MTIRRLDVLVACVVTIVIVLGYSYFFSPDIVFFSDKKEYYHYEFINLYAKVKSNKLKKKLEGQPIKFCIVNKYGFVENIGLKRFFLLKYNRQTGLWENRRWPCPWNVPVEKYWVVPVFDENITVKTKSKKFVISRRKPAEFSSGMGILTFENMNPLASIKMINPERKRVGWKGLVDWTEFIGADTFWCIGGATIYYKEKLDEEFPWVDYNFDLLDDLGKECHNRGIKFGVWAIAYMTSGKSSLAPQYEYSWDYKNGVLKRTRSVSLNDEKRIKDLISFYKRLNDIPEIDFFGVDYIRNALGGYELVDDFVEEMEVEVPSGWEKLSKEKRMVWLAKKKIARKDMNLIDQWQWWRAHKTANIIRRIKKEAGITKPFWAFTLSWEKGWQHGQDPIMMNDAGVDIDAVMLYECDREEFDELLGEWNNYTKKNQVNLVVGNVVDWPLHQYSLSPPGPEEFYNRKIEAVKKMYSDSVVGGIFIHDLGRALWGRRKPYTRYEWLFSGAAAISTMRKLTSAISISMNCKLKRGQHEFFAQLDISNKNPEIESATLKLYNYMGSCTFYKTVIPTSGTIMTLNIPLTGDYSSNSGKKFISAVIEWQEKGEKKKFTTFKYFD